MTILKRKIKQFNSIIEKGKLRKRVSIISPLLLDLVLFQDKGVETCSSLLGFSIGKSEIHDHRLN